MSSDIKVSVQCITYNHKNYIRKALDGFVMQVTNFKFEVIVHDDASTDGTADIIREYAEKYDFIKPIFQKENQYSQGIMIARKYIEPMISGEYIAFCEGDDYWTNPNKLQILYDYMISHPKCSMCCHAYENIEANTEKVVAEVHTLLKDGEISIAKAIKYDNPTQLASQMFRRDCIIDKPAIYYGRGVGDYTVLLYAATKGEIHYINRIMARHRVASDGSWTNRIYKNKELRIKHDQNMISFLKDFDSYYENEYQEYIGIKIDEFMMDIAITENDFKGQLKNPGYKALSLKRKVLINLGILFPKLSILLEKMYRR